MEATDVSWIVYELIRVKDDRNNMTHEDVVSKLFSKISELKSRNKKLNFQLKDLYRKYEKAMDGEESAFKKLSDKNDDPGKLPVQSLFCPSLTPKSALLPVSPQEHAVENDLKRTNPEGGYPRDGRNNHHILGRSETANRVPFATTNGTMIGCSSSRSSSSIKGVTDGLLLETERGGRSVELSRTHQGSGMITVVADTADDLNFDADFCTAVEGLCPLRIIPMHGDHESSHTKSVPHPSNGSLAIVTAAAVVSHDHRDDQHGCINQSSRTTTSDATKVVVDLSDSGGVADGMSGGGVVGMPSSKLLDGSIVEIFSRPEAQINPKPETSREKVEDVDATFFQDSVADDVCTTETRSLQDFLQVDEKKRSECPSRESRSHLLSPKNILFFREWLTAFQVATSRIFLEKSDDLTADGIDEVIRIVPLSAADLSGIMSRPFCQELLLATVYSFLEHSDLLHLFPSISCPTVEESLLWRNPLMAEIPEPLRLCRIPAKLLTVGAGEDMHLQRKRSAKIEVYSNHDRYKRGTSSYGNDLNISSSSNSSSSSNKNDKNNSGGSSSNGNSRDVPAGSIVHPSSRSTAPTRSMTFGGRLSVATNQSTRKSLRVENDFGSKKRKPGNEFEVLQNDENKHINIRQPLWIPQYQSRQPSSSSSSSSSSSVSRVIPGSPITAIQDPSKKSPPPPHSSSMAVSDGSKVLQRRNTMSDIPLTSTGKRAFKCVEVVRKKGAREALPGHQCTECTAYYEALLQQGLVTEEGMQDMLQKCSRHKARWSPPHTPDGFWDLTVRTPDKWH